MPISLVQLLSNAVDDSFVVASSLAYFAAGGLSRQAHPLFLRQPLQFFCNRRLLLDHRLSKGFDLGPSGIAGSHLAACKLGRARLHSLHKKSLVNAVEGSGSSEAKRIWLDYPTLEQCALANQEIVATGL